MCDVGGDGSRKISREIIHFQGMKMEAQKRLNILAVGSVQSVGENVLSANIVADKNLAGNNSLSGHEKEAQKRLNILA